MKKIVLGMLFFTFSLSGCASNNDESVISSNTSDSIITNTETTSNSEAVDFQVFSPTYTLDRNEMAITGTAPSGNKIQVLRDSDELGVVEAKNGKFRLYLPLEEAEDVIYEVSDGKSMEKITIKSKTSLEKTAAEVEAKRKEQEKAKAEAEKKAAEESAAKEAEEKAAAEKKKREAEEAERKAVEAEKASYDTGISYENLARNPDTYMLEKVKFNGRIIQVIKGEDVSQFRFAIDDDYDQVILIEISEDQLSNNRLLEDDNITIRGVSYGEYTYSSTIGGEITVPAVVVDSFELN